MFKSQFDKKKHFLFVAKCVSLKWESQIYGTRLFYKKKIAQDNNKQITKYLHYWPFPLPPVDFPHGFFA